MAKNDKNLVRVVGVKPTTIGMLQGTLFMLIGLVVAIAVLASDSIAFAGETQNMLKGLIFGLTNDVLVIILVPLLYFLGGWVLGLIYGFIINLLLSTSGGIVLKTRDTE